MLVLYLSASIVFYYYFRGQSCTFYSTAFIWQLQYSFSFAENISLHYLCFYLFNWKVQDSDCYRLNYIVQKLQLFPAQPATRVKCCFHHLLYFCLRFCKTCTCNGEFLHYYYYCIHTFTVSEYLTKSDISPGHKVFTHWLRFCGLWNVNQLYPPPSWI